MAPSLFLIVWSTEFPSHSSRSTKLDSEWVVHFPWRSTRSLVLFIIRVGIQKTGNHFCNFVFQYQMHKTTWKCINHNFAIWNIGNDLSNYNSFSSSLSLWLYGFNHLRILFDKQFNLWPTSPSPHIICSRLETFSFAFIQSFLRIVFGIPPFALLFVQFQPAAVSSFERNLL